MIDIHSHILPRIDDGARDWASSIEMAKAAVKNGIKSVIATPHHQNGVYMNHLDKVIEVVYQFNRLLEDEKIPLIIYPGNETRIHADFVKGLRNKEFLTLNRNGRYVLFELPYDIVPHYTEQIIFNIQLAGFTPIIPHPERNLDIRRNPTKLYQLVKSGALTQITSGSLLGLFGRDIYKFSLKLMEHHLTHFLATDSHKAVGSRGMNLLEGYEELTDFGGRMLADRFKGNAEKVLEGKDIHVDQPIKILKRKKWFGMF